MKHRLPAVAALKAYFRSGGSTQAITFPTPLVWVPIDGHSCIGAASAGNVKDHVNGFVS